MKINISIEELNMDELTTLCGRLGTPCFNEAVAVDDQAIENFIPLEPEPEPVKTYDRNDVTRLAVEYMKMYSRDLFAQLLKNEFDVKRAQDVKDEEVEKLCKLLEEALNG